MTQFVIGQPVTTAVPGVSVDAGLPVGRHRFRLVVVDSAGNRSQPDDRVVQVLAASVGPLTHVVTPIDPVSPG